MKKEVLIKFGQRVREERIKQGLSQERLASRARSSSHIYGNDERAEKNITLENIEKIAKALEMKIGDFF